MDFLNKLSPYSHWFVRVSLALTFLYHGFTKFPMASGMAQMMGMPVAMVYLLAIMELAGGILILWGGFGPNWATQAAGAIFVVVMLGAIMMFHFQNGWSFTQGWGEGTNHMGGMEFQALVLVSGLLFLTNPNVGKS